MEGAGRAGGAAVRVPHGTPATPPTRVSSCPARRRPCRQVGVTARQESEGCCMHDPYRCNAGTAGFVCWHYSPVNCWALLRRVAS